MTREGYPMYQRQLDFLPEHERSQMLLQQASILVAGCGAGSTVIDRLVRQGIGIEGGITGADPDIVVKHNLGRQNFNEKQLGMNKAIAAMQRVNEINPQAKVYAVTEGITLNNVESLVKGKTAVVDMIDVSQPGAMFALHRSAQEQHVPVVSSLDLGYQARSYVYDYRDPKAMTLERYLGLPEGLSYKELEQIDPSGLNITAQLIMRRPAHQMKSLDEVKSYYDTLTQKYILALFTELPREMWPVAAKMMMGQIDYIPQTDEAANMVGAMQASAIRNIILSNPVRRVPDIPKMSVNTLVTKPSLGSTIKETAALLWQYSKQA